MSELRDTFLALLEPTAAARVAETERAILSAIIAGDDGDLAALRAELVAMKALPASIVDGDRAALTAQWPAGFPPLPDWFTNPDSVGEPGEPCVVDCKPPEAAASADMVDAATEAKILAMRAEQAPADDEARKAALKRDADVRSDIARKITEGAAQKAVQAALLALNTDREATAEDLGL